MRRKNKVILFSFLFIVVSIGDLYGVVTGNSTIEAVFKPLILTLLVIFYLVSVTKPNFWVVSAMFFSFVGDVFLLFNESYFVFGLGSFLITHLIYIKISSGFLKKISTRKLFLVSIPFVLFLVLLIGLIYPNLNELKIPVFAYATIIATFGVVALLNYVEEKSTENGWYLIGVLVFMISDSLIAIDKFYQTNEIYGVLIMITYILAQYLICKVLIQKNNLD